MAKQTPQGTPTEQAQHPQDGYLLKLDAFQGGCLLGILYLRKEKHNISPMATEMIGNMITQLEDQINNKVIKCSQQP